MKRWMPDPFSYMSVNCLRNREGLNDMRYPRAFFRARMTEGTPVQNHVLKMIKWIEKLTGLGMVLEDNLCVDIVLQSLLDSFS